MNLLYENKNHLIIIIEKDDEIEINCLRDSIIYSNSQNYNKEYFYSKSHFKEIISEFKNNNITIKKGSNDGELQMTIRHIITFNSSNNNHNFSNKKSHKKDINDSEFDYALILENNSIYIDITQNNKNYIFVIDNNHLYYNDNLQEIYKLIDNEDNEINIKEKNNRFYLEIKKEISCALKEPQNQTEMFKINQYVELSKNDKLKLNLKRIEKLETEINEKQEEINNDNKSLLKNINVMKDNAEIFIFPKKKFPSFKKDKGVNMESNIIVKIDDFNLINNKLTSIYGQDVEYKLLYIASRDRDAASIFKKKCEYVRGTLIVIKTQNKRVFGGFTTQIWDDSEQNYDDDRAFCFSVNEKKIYELKQYCSAIGCDKNSGPRFNYMFMIFNNCFLKGGETWPEELSHYNGQKRDYELTDGEKYFIVDEMEAFKISPK